MSHTAERFSYAVVASKDFRTLIHRVIDFGGDLSVANGVSAMGIMQSAPNSGQPVALAYFGVLKAFAGATITTPGYPLTTAASGYVIAAVSGSHVIGRYVTAGTSLGMAAASGDMFTGLYNFNNARPIGAGSGYA